MPAADKAEFYSEDKRKHNRLFSGSGFETLGEKYWIDVLELRYPLPSGDTSGWPHKPQRLREVAGNYTALERGVSQEIQRLLCEGLGLRPDYFEGDISSARVVVDVNYYPPCPLSGRTLGLPPHCDRDLMTVLLPGKVPGLEIAYKDGWIKVQAVPTPWSSTSACSSRSSPTGCSRPSSTAPPPTRSSCGCRWRRSSCQRTAASSAPGEEFVSEDNPPRYSTMTVGEFKRTHNVVSLGSSINQVIDLKNNQMKM
ncbi:unnamed protein product [Urochloa humidicola]